MRVTWTQLHTGPNATSVASIAYSLNVKVKCGNNISFYILRGALKNLSDIPAHLMGTFVRINIPRGTAANEEDYFE